MDWGSRVVVDLDPYSPTWAKADGRNATLDQKDPNGEKRGGLRHAAKSGLLRTLHLRPATYDDEEETFRDALLVHYSHLRYKARKMTHISFDRRENVEHQLRRPGRSISAYIKKIRPARLQTRIPPSFQKYAVLASPDHSATQPRMKAPEVAPALDLQAPLLTHHEMHEIVLPSKSSSHPDDGDHEDKISSNLDLSPAKCRLCGEEGNPKSHPDNIEISVTSPDMDTPKTVLRRRAHSRSVENILDGLDALTLSPQVVSVQSTDSQDRVIRFQGLDEVPLGGSAPYSTSTQLSRRVFLNERERKSVGHVEDLIEQLYETKEPDIISTRPQELDLPTSDSNPLSRFLEVDAIDSREDLHGGGKPQLLAPASETPLLPISGTSFGGTGQTGSKRPLSDQIPLEGPSEPERGEEQSLGLGSKKQRANPFDGGTRVVCAVWAKDPQNAPASCQGYSHPEVYRMKADHLIKGHKLTNLAILATIEHGRSLSQREQFNRVFTSLYPTITLPVSPFWSDRHAVIEQRDFEAGRDPQISEISQHLPALMQQLRHATAPANLQRAVAPAQDPQQRFSQLENRIAQLEEASLRQASAFTPQGALQHRYDPVTTTPNLQQSQPHASTVLSEQQMTQDGVFQFGALFDTPELPPALMANTAPDAPPYTIPALSAPAQSGASAPPSNDKPLVVPDDSGIGLESPANELLTFCNPPYCCALVQYFGQSCYFHSNEYEGLEDAYKPNFESDTTQEPDH